MAIEFKTQSAIKTGRAVCEVRTIASVSFYTKMFQVAELLTKEFEFPKAEWQTDGFHVVLTNKEQGTKFTLRHNLWHFVWELPASLEKFVKFSAAIQSICLKEFGCSEVERVGVRIQAFKAKEIAFGELVKLFYLQCYSDPLRRLESLKDKITDEAVVLNTEEKNWQGRLTFGPCKEKEVFDRLKLELPVDEAVKKKLSQVSLWCDSDTYQVKLDIGKIPNLISETTSRNVDSITEILDYLDKK